jgi:hypothetical protein
MQRQILRTMNAAALFFISMNVYAIEPGFYVGLMGGAARNNGSNQTVQVQTTQTTTASPNSNQFGSRLYMGYKMNPFAAVEAGLTYFSTINYDTKGVTTCSNAAVRVRDFDFVGKGSYTFHGFELFGKAGAAIVYQTSSGTLNPVPSQPCGQTNYITSIRPTFGLGVGYDLSQTWVTDLSWTRVEVGGFAGSMDLFAIGISYHFVDIYCGQFLCG